MVHEIGHVKHKQHNPSLFFDMVKPGYDEALDGAVKPRLKAASMKVSQYACKNACEFVAEVFTGLVNGVRYPQTVIDLYKDFGGFPTWSRGSDVVEPPPVAVPPASGGSGVGGVGSGEAVVPSGESGPGVGGDKVASSWPSSPSRSAVLSPTSSRPTI